MSAINLDPDSTPNDLNSAGNRLQNNVFGQFCVLHPFNDSMIEKTLSKYENPSSLLYLSI
jgi:hypothetical protein